MHEQAGGSAADEASQAVVQSPTFRLDNEHLAFRFTATLSDRYSDPIERLNVPVRLDDWLGVSGIRLGNEPATEQDLMLAHRLREAIHQAGRATAVGSDTASADVDLINNLAREGGVYPELIGTAMRWRSGSEHPVRAALGLVAHDAVAVLGGDQRARVKVCANPVCGGLYVDTSRGQNRRWCSMNFCGNRAKKARFRHAGAG